MDNIVSILVVTYLFTLIPTTIYVVTSKHKLVDILYEAMYDSFDHQSIGLVLGFVVTISMTLASIIMLTQTTSTIADIPRKFILISGLLGFVGFQVLSTTVLLNAVDTLNKVNENKKEKIIVKEEDLITTENITKILNK